MKYFIIMILLCGIFLSFCSKSSSNDPEPVTVEDLLVKDNEISGWTRTGNGWYASNNTELYDAINGAGQIYIDYGFVEGAMQEYQGPVPNQDPSFVSLQIIDLGSTDNAQALFDYHVNQMSFNLDWEGGAGQDAKIKLVGFVYQLVFWDKTYFVFVEIPENTPEALEIIKIFAANVDSKIQ